jgi:ribosomal-protein-alanine N-acetyltransferase
MSLPTPTLHTARLRLRPFTDADADALYALHSSAHVLRYWDAPPWSERARAERFIAACRQMADEGVGARLAVDRVSDGAFIGWCSLNRWNPDYRSASLGYCFDDAAWGHGYATEAARALLRWAFDTLDLNRVQAETDTRNGASARVLEKLGFVLEGTLREDCVVNGEVSDSWVYGLIRREWRPSSRTCIENDAAVTSSPWPMRVGSLLLREAAAADIERLLSFRNDPAVNRFMLRTSVDPETFRDEWLAVPTSESDFSCVVEVDGTAAAMGFLEIVDGMGQPGMPKGTEGVIGYIVDPDFAGRGVASGLARGLLAAAFGHLGLRRVTASCNADNPASARVLEKAGMRREQHGVEDSWHAELGWVDGYQYAILAREWPALHDASPPQRF